MRITQIELKNFRAFYDKSDIIKLADGKNLLVLGENGSGKSSLYFAIKDFFEAYDNGLNITQTPYRNLFATDDETFVKIKFTNGVTYEWSNTNNSPHNLTSQTFEVVKGFIDYKGLLQTYFFQHRDNRINVFDFIVGEVLADYFPFRDTTTIKELLSQAKKAIPKRNTERQIENISRLIEKFNTNLKYGLSQLEKKAQQILDDFKINLTVNFGFAGISYDETEKTILNKDINLRVKFYGQDKENHHQYLNEAKLSAIAIALYFGALLIRPEGKMEILVLDDVLIGLDMSNREFVLNIVEKYFRVERDFQVFIFTYDEVWFMRLEKKFSDWQKLNFRTIHNGGFEIPSISEWQDYIKKADYFLGIGEKKSAANMARQFFEEFLKKICEKKNLKVQYQRMAKNMKLDFYWKAVLDQTTINTTNAGLIADIEADRASIYNPLSHDHPILVSIGDVKHAVDRLKQLKTELGKL